MKRRGATKLNQSFLLKKKNVKNKRRIRALLRNSSSKLTLSSPTMSVVLLGILLYFDLDDLHCNECLSN
ncbi:hypothetical protein KIN20_011167 [Parelaphostrongylus tenuis]|uniref:Uncharacterized protein n=1 Tax=Parelaphostrongylus tenuis TaxID=148309 RepID=A0AAD5MZX4_PARTN|nr:hypothetical protein KIN20_011167 [Parelaphostrongylus tenuis]